MSFSIAESVARFVSAAGNRPYFAALKPRLAERFRQDDIWMTTHPVEVVG